MEESAGNDLEVKTSGAANDAALSKSDAIAIADLSSSTLIEGQSSGPVNEISFEKSATFELNADKAVDMHSIEAMPTLIETTEPDKPGKNAKFNLRKSLAWDSAFFTSDGFLDAEELSTMIGAGEKGIKHQLPGIKEEVCKSMESISTIESDNLSLECLEAELFEDIRASIQKSSRTPKLNNSTIKVSSAKTDSQTKVSSSSKKMDFDSGKRPAARIKDNASLIPQPKMVNRVTSTSILTKRASLSANQAKKDQDIAKQAHAKTITPASKTTGVTGPRRGVPKPSLSSKSSSGPSTAPKMEPTRPSSSSSNSSRSSGNDVKVKPAASFSRKVDSKTSKLTAGSIPKTHSKIGVKNKVTPVNPRLPSNFSNRSSNMSPASSVSEWSSESSSPTSTINRKSTSRGSIDTNASQRSFDGDVSIDSALIIHPTSQNANQAPTQAASLSLPSAVQPTGLRMPSPKIGFFDGGKSGVRTPNAAKFGKLPPSKTTAAQMKPNLQKTAPKPSQTPINSRGVKSILETSDLKDEISTQGSEKHKIEPSLNISMNLSNTVDNNSKGQSFLGNKSSSKKETHKNGEIEVLNMDCASESLSNEGFVAVKDKKLDKTMTDDSRTPFALKNSICDTTETGMEVPEKPVNFLFLESEHKENSEVI